MFLFFKRILFFTLLPFLFAPLPLRAQVAATIPASAFDLSPTAFKTELTKQKGLVLDVRTPAEYAQSHLPNAINIDYRSPDFKQAIKQLKPSQTYFVYCAVGGRSAKACSQLESMGLPKVYNLKGGITAWQQAGLAIVK